jgi:hypothetical protein
MPSALVRKYSSTHTPATDAEPSLLRKLEVGPHPYAQDDQRGIEPAPVLEGHRALADLREGLTQVEPDPVLFVKRAYESTELCPEHGFHGDLIGRDDVHAQSSLRERGRDFEPDEARAHDYGPLRALRMLDDRFAVAKGAQVMDVRQVRSRHVEPDRRRPGSQEQRSKRERASILEPNLSPFGIDRRHPVPQQEINARVPVPFRRAKRHPLGGSSSRQVILGDVRTVVGSDIVGRHDGDRTFVSFTAQHLRGREAGPTASDDDHRSRR